MIRLRDVLDLRNGRALLAGALVIPMLLSLKHGVPWWRRAVTAARQERLRAESRLSRARLALAGAPATADSLVDAREQLLALAPQFLEGSSPQAAAATLLSLVSGAAGRPGVQVGSLQASADTAAFGNFILVQVRGDLTADVLGTMGFLADLEAMRVLVRVPELSVDQPEPNAPHDRAEQLRVRFLVEGLAPRSAR